MDLKEKYSIEGITNRITEKVDEAFPIPHNIKTALFKPVSEYNDETNDYNPILILIDTNFDEVDHNINVWDLVPDADEQSDYYEQEAEDLYVPEVTVKF